MKVGDLVLYKGYVERVGIVIDGPKRDFLQHYNNPRWEVFWMYSGKFGWWQEDLMEMINESR